jgi:Lipocalin-like domain
MIYAVLQKLPEGTMGKASFAGLIGSWRQISLQFRMSDNSEVIDEPRQAVCTFDANGRWTVVGVPSDVAGPTNDTERAAIFNRIVAFSGRCELNGNQMNVKVDVAWNPAFKGMEFTRFIELEGDRLTITQPEWEHPFFKGRKTVVVVSWERER